MKLFDAVIQSPVKWWDPKMMHNPGHLSPARDEVLRWAHTSSEIRAILSADLMLYEFALGVFKRQTSHHLGTVWGS